MKRIFVVASLFALTSGVYAQNKPSGKPTVIHKPASATLPKATAATGGLNNTVDSVSYAIGNNIGQNLKNQGLGDANMDLLMKGMNDAMKGNPSLIDPAKANTTIQKYFQGLQAKKYEAVKGAGEKFLAENKTKPGVVTTASGLQYQVMKQGDGAKPMATDKVKVHYHGTTIDGQVFDSSVDRGEPISFQLNGLIQGWIEAIQLMPVGSKWKLFIPYNLAYGEAGGGPKIPPFSALIFEVELLGIEK